MATREEIREGIYQIIKGNCQSSSGWVGNKAYTMDLIMNYLHSQGVVIKVDRELPTDCISYLENEKGIIKSVWADEEKVKASGWEAVDR